MKKKIIWLTVSCLMVVALLVTSCGGATTEEEEDITNGEEDVVGEEEEEEVGEEEEVSDGKDMVLDSLGKLVEKPRYGGVLNFAASSDPRGFDEATTPPYSTVTMPLTNDKLISGDWAKGTQGTGEASWLHSATFFYKYAVGSLATSWEIPDDETIIFHIREGVHFQNKPPVNGREMNAHDVVFSLERLYFDDSTYSYATYPEGRGPTSIKALDDWTVEIKVPVATQIPLLFAMGDFNSIVAHEIIDEYGDMRDWENSWGTGPFTITDYVPVSALTFERNPNYWMNDPLHPDNQLPYLDGIKRLIIPDASTTLAAFRTGKLDRRAISWEDEPEIRENNPELKWLQTLATGTAVIYMRLDTDPYTDIRVRRALSMAVDQQSMVDYYYEGNAELHATLVGPFPELGDIYTPLEELPESTRELFDYDLDKARDLLAEAGYPDGFKATIVTSSEGVLPIIKDSWSKIGVDLDIQIKTSAVLYSIQVRRQHEEMIYYGLSNNKVKINTFEKQMTRNLSMADDETYQRLFDESLLTMMDPDKFNPIVKEMVQYIIGQVWYVPLPAPYTYYAWWPWVKSYGGESSVGYFRSGDYTKYVWIDQELREEITGRKQ